MIATSHTPTQEAQRACEHVAKVTKKICGSGACAFGRYGCCDRAFCEAVKESLAPLGGLVRVHRGG